LVGVSQADRKNNRNPVNAKIQAEMEKMNWARENQAMRFLIDPQIAEIRLKYFVGDDLPKWLEESFKTLRAKDAKGLILDLRNNGGGEDMYGALLLSYLTDRPFRYLERIELKTIAPSFKRYSDWSSNVENSLREGTFSNPAGGFLGTTNLHQGLAVQKPSDHPFLGKVFVLTDGGTFSTAADFCAVTHHLNRATFVGEETGGGYCGNNSGFEPRVRLPNSKLQVRVPMYEYWNAVSAPERKRSGTIPDVPVETKVADWLLANDQPLEKALNLAKQGLSSQ
jgi:C-terminal processing protease CtpA/Prc